MSDHLSSLKTVDLVKVFNAATGSSVKRFETRERAVARVRAALDQAGLAPDQALRAAGIEVASPVVEVAPPVETEQAAAPKANESGDVCTAVLAMAREKPCRMRDFMASIPDALGWAGVNKLTAKRRVRQAINSLVSTNRLTWTDMEAKGARYFVVRS